MSEVPLCAVPYAVASRHSRLKGLLGQVSRVMERRQDVRSVRNRDIVELMTSDHKIEASRQGSRWRCYVCRTCCSAVPHAAVWVDAFAVHTESARWVVLKSKPEDTSAGCGP